MATGPSSSASPYLLPVSPSVSFTSILTVGDSVGGYKMAGIPDGLGAFDNGNGTFTVLMNHEINNTLGVNRAHGGKGAFVSSWVINKSDLSVVSGSDLIQNVYNWNTGTQSSDSTTSTIDFSRFCSADLPPVTAYYNAASGLGTQARIFMDGEEGGVNGLALANVATGPDKGKTYILGKFNLATNGSGTSGVGGWENLLANPLAQDKTVVIGNNDGGTGIMNGSVAVYVGNKQSTGTEADKAGLTNGTLKFVSVTGFADTNGTTIDELSNTTTRTTNITSGTAFTLSGTTPTTFSRPEDGAWNPLNPNQYFFVTTDRLDQVADGVGSQIGRSRLWRLNFNDITNPDAGGTIDLLLDGTEGQNMLDNMTVDNFGHIILQEDVGNAAHLGKIWQYDIASDTLTKIATHDPARFGDIGVAATAPFNQDEESSGVIDVQNILGPGMNLIDVQAHYSIPGELVEGGQLLAFFNLDTYASAKGIAPANRILGTSGNNNLRATATGQVLYGADGNDVLDGNAGGDTLIGGSGRDVMRAGPNDIIKYISLTDSVASPVNSYDSIINFNQAQGDRFELPTVPTALSNAGVVTGADLVAAATAAYAQVGLGANQATFFTWNSRTFLSANNSTAAFNPTGDLVVEVTGLIGGVPGSPSVGNYFI